MHRRRAGADEAAGLDQRLDHPVGPNPIKAARWREPDYGMGQPLTVITRLHSVQVGQRPGGTVPGDTALSDPLRRRTNPREVTVVHNHIKTAMPALMLAIAAGSSTGCSGPSMPAATPPTSAAPTPAAPTSTRPTPAAAASSPLTTTSGPATATILAPQACTSEVLLPLMKRKFDDPSRELVIERVDIERCRNGYAHVFAISRRNPPGDPQYENEQLFLRLVDGQWQSVAEGTGISCSDDDLRPELVAPCRGLGY